MKKEIPPILGIREVDVMRNGFQNNDDKERFFYLVGVGASLRKQQNRQLDIGKSENDLRQDVYQFLSYIYRYNKFEDLYKSESELFKDFLYPPS